MRIPQFDNLMILLRSGLLSRHHSDRCIHVFYDAAKIVHYRQERLQKSQLKVHEVTSALMLVHFHHTSIFRFTADGPLAQNFKDCNEAKALEYYEKSVMGKVGDQFGRNILIDEDGIKFLYKEAQSGKHTVAPENYEETRGKRLPWIRHVLCNSKAAYAVEEKLHGKFRRSYIYTAIASIPLKPAPAAAVSYFVVVVSEDGNKNLKFLTAYAINGFNKFLKCIETGKPLG